MSQKEYFIQALRSAGRKGKTTYTADYSSLPVGHGEKSVIRLLQWGHEESFSYTYSPHVPNNLIPCPSFANFL